MRSKQDLELEELILVGLERYQYLAGIGALRNMCEHVSGGN